MKIDAYKLEDPDDGLSIGELDMEDMFISEPNGYSRQHRRVTAYGDTFAEALFKAGLFLETNEITNVWDVSTGPDAAPPYISIHYVKTWGA